MRQVPPGMDNIWASGDYTTDGRRPMARVTIQHLDMRLFDLGYNLYASLVFGAPSAPPKELPNVKAVKWQRGVDTDIATATIEFYNTAPQPLGTTFQRQWGVDYPGYYTFTRGKTSFSSRWGHLPNEWQGLLVPDNILRTYEGYGFDATMCPDQDPHLVQSGMWIIKDVEYDAAGTIVCTCEDMGSILRDQIAFVPVIPKNFYPLSFTSEPSQSGFKDGYTYTKTVDATGVFDPAHPPPADWAGPTDAPVVTSVTAGDKDVVVNWTAVAAPPTGYTLLGYQVVVDRVTLPTLYPTSAVSAHINGAPWTNGNVFLTQVVALYQRNSDKHRQPGSRSAVQYARPSATGTTSAVTPGSIRVNMSPAGTPPLGVVAWDYTGALVSTFTVVCYKNGQTPKAFSVIPNGPGTQYAQTGLGDLSSWNVVVWPLENTLNGKGDLFQGPDGAFLAPPVGGSVPHEPNPSGKGKVLVTTPDGKKVPLKPKKAAVSFSDSSNTYYVGAGSEVSVYGHAPKDALDGNPATFWLSIGNARADQGYSYEWYEVNVGNVELSQVHFTTAKGDYFVYISVFAKGTWVHYAASDVIPYDPKNPESHNGGNIPYVGTSATGSGEGPHTHTFKTSIPGVTKVRLTFHNLQDFGLGTLHYRAGLREISVSGTGSDAGEPNSGVPESSAPDTASTIVKTYEVYVPPREVPGAGEQPGFYEDFTDIVKLFLAWGGFYWPEDAQELSCNGAATHYSWGPGPFGLKNVDPVLGDQSSGRVWGDLQNTGRSGLVTIPIQQWDKKSLLDGISYVRDIIGHVFFIDEGGGAVWRQPNIFSIGNYVGNLAASPSRVPTIVTIDETQTLISLRAKLSSRNVRERYFIASVDGKTAGLSKGFNPNPIGLRRVGGWTDQRFGSDSAEAQIMAEMIALRALLTYQQDTIQIPGYPRIQVDDQVRIFEQVTGEGYLHYVRGISSTNDLESGVWTYDLDTSWLGENPLSYWVFELSNLSDELKTYLDATTALGTGAFAPPPSPDDPGGTGSIHPPGPLSNPTTGVGSITRDVKKVAKLVKVASDPAVYITDGIIKRHVTNQQELGELVRLGLVPSAVPDTVLQATLDAIPLDAS